MKTNALFIKSLLLTALLFTGIAWAAVAQTTATIGIRSTGSTYTVFITPTNTATTDLLDATQIAIIVPTGSTFNIGTITSAIPGVSWSLGAPKDTYNGNDYFIIVPSAVAGSQTFTAGQPKDLFSFTTSGSCAGQVSISTATTFTPLPGGADGSTYLAFTNNGGGANNGFTGTVTQSAPCSSIAVTSSSVSLTANSGVAANSNVGTAAGVTGGSGTYTYAVVSCASPTSTTTTSTNGGAVTVSASGAVTYTSTANFSGPDTFCIRVCDSADPTSCQVVTYNVNVASNCPQFTLPTLSK